MSPGSILHEGLRPLKLPGEVMPVYVIAAICAFSVS